MINAHPVCVCIHIMIKLLEGKPQIHRLLAPFSELPSSIFISLEHHLQEV